MRLHTRTKPDAKTPRLRRRFGYDRHWWGPPKSAESTEESYWVATRRALPSLIFVLPLLLIYETAILRQGGSAAAGLRGAADGWISAGFRLFGLVDPWWPPFTLALALLGLHAVERRPIKFRGGYLLGMIGECGLLAVVLIGLGKAIDLCFQQIEELPTLAEGAKSAGTLVPVVEYLGVGLYEELLFRLALIPLLLGGLRLLRSPRFVSQTFALTASALVFSLAHHLGEPGESFSWFAFVFRWSAGIYFGWIFCERGYGVAVGTHAAYDIMVGSLGLRL